MFLFYLELHRCSSVTYELSAEECQGSELGNKCKQDGERLARIKDAASLDAVKKVITGQDEYWTGLR